MGNKSFLTSILGLLFVLVCFSPLGLNDQNVFGSTSNGVENAPVEQPLQQSLSNNGTSGAQKMFTIHMNSILEVVHRICLF